MKNKIVLALIIGLISNSLSAHSHSTTEQQSTILAQEKSAQNTKKIKSLKPSQETGKKLPIVKDYDISFLGIENLHPFDTKKYGKIAQYLQNKCNVSFFEPSKVTDEELLTIHSKQYLESLKESHTIAAISEVLPLKFLPNFLLQRFFLNSVRYATEGTVLGAQLALEHGWAINLGGGYHHAKPAKGGGFCFFADIPLAIKTVRKEYPALKVLVIDLDAHQGNGIEMALKDDKLSSILDVYVQDNYPFDHSARKHITFDYPIAPGVKDKEYLELLKSAIPQAINEIKPDLIIYNAGSDVFEKDPIGKTALTQEGIVQRDAFVFTEAHNNEIPVLMVLSGGYTKESALITAHSIEHILKNIIKVC